MALELRTIRELEEVEYRALRAKELIDEAEAELHAQRGVSVDEVAVFFTRLFAAWVVVACIWRML